MTGQIGYPSVGTPVLLASDDSQAWLDRRFKGLTLVDFDPNALFLSTARLRAPEGFQSQWLVIDPKFDPTKSVDLLNGQEAEELDAIFIICNQTVEQEVQMLRSVIEALNDLDVDLPPIFWIPHSVAPERRAPGGAAGRVHSDLLTDLFMHALDGVVPGELEGHRLAMAAQARIRKAASLSSNLACIAQQREERLMHCKTLRSSIHTTLWCYIRSKSAPDIPPLDFSIPSGEPAELSGFKLGSRLGRGKFGTVYIALSDNSDDPPSAIKLSAKDSLNRVQDVKYVNRMIGVMRHLSQEPGCHPNLVRLHETYHSPTHIILRIEFAGLENLFQRLRAREQRSEAERRPLSLQRVLDMVQQLVGVLAHMHTTARCCHRDIKPENIITREDADGITAKLTDFDLAVIISQSTTCRSACGTLPFTAPEVLIDGAYDGCCADVWSLGVVLLEIFCGLNVVEGVIGQAASPQEMATRIRAYFQVPDAAQNLLERACRQELRVSLRGLKPMVSGMLESDVYQRLEADEVLSVVNQQFLASAS